MNRAQRRAKGPQQADDPVQVEQQQREQIQHGTPRDVTSERAKSQRHGKVTADKWNQ